MQSNISTVWTHTSAEATYKCATQLEETVIESELEILQ